jgi:hypothetical protein
MSSQISSVVLNNLISLKDAAECSGYSLQYIRWLLRLDKLTGLKLGHVWLIEMESFEAYLINAECSNDHRFGPN